MGLFVNQLVAFLTLYTPFLAAALLLVSLHTYLIVAKTPRLRLHSLLASLAYLVLFAGFALALALFVRRSFSQVDPVPEALAGYSLIDYLAPSPFAFPFAVLGIIAAIWGTTRYANARVSSRQSAHAVIILAIAVVLFAITLFITSLVYVRWLVG